ncbi:nucleotidyltransferase domain-containing protein [Oscillibacter sp. MSJ-2]|uniref:Nucleotidyltransferase domain-containing protein n=1 Tax=Dysosmobacter acutus TaxID=2841504 RepID=A0ABS6FEQ1_9FIRM|nr:nucleotidyltransferase domain-containing protein [Dysosmobacter acutus]MBU5627835.1 nucleotidyltransferase domain-containing protein [Dysosmobacter acutus]
MKQWIDQYCAAVKAAFPCRIVCIGLQGSWGRGEATASSDIDMVLILDRMDAGDMLRYRQAVAALPRRELLCGFVGGNEELLGWEAGDLCSLYLDTTPLLGDLAFLRGRIDADALRRGVLSGACAIYHACAHNLIHAQSVQHLAAVQKSAFFTLRLHHCLKTGQLIRRRSQLLELLSPEERLLLETPPDRLEELSARLITWSGGLIRSARHTG